MLYLVISLVLFISFANSSTCPDISPFSRSTISEILLFFPFEVYSQELASYLDLFHGNRTSLYLSFLLGLISCFLDLLSSSGLRPSFGEAHLQYFWGLKMLYNEWGIG